MTVSRSRLRDGVKPAIASTAALLICQWFNPPGAAAIVGRLFWPVLPEAELRKRFTDFFSICSNFLTKQPGHDDEVLSETLTFIPIESVSWEKGLKGRHCPESEVEKIVALTFILRRLALRLSARAHAPPSLALPEEIARIIDPVVEKAKGNFRMTSETIHFVTSIFWKNISRSCQILINFGRAYPSPATKGYASCHSQ